MQRLATIGLAVLLSSSSAGAKVTGSCTTEGRVKDVRIEGDNTYMFFESGALMVFEGEYYNFVLVLGEKYRISFTVSENRCDKPVRWTNYRQLTGKPFYTPPEKAQKEGEQPAPPEDESPPEEEEYPQGDFLSEWEG